MPTHENVRLAFFLPLPLHRQSENDTSGWRWSLTYWNNINENENENENGNENGNEDGEDGEGSGFATILF